MLVQGANEKKNDRELYVTTCCRKEMSRRTIVTVWKYITVVCIHTNDDALMAGSSSNEVVKIGVAYIPVNKKIYIYNKQMTCIPTRINEPMARNS